MIKRTLTTLALAFAIAVPMAQPASAATCSSGWTVRMQSNTSINAWHTWNTGQKHYSSGGSHTTDTNKQSTYVIFATSGNMYSPSTYCAPG